MNTAIIILNWNGGIDTINCLKSIGNVKNDEYLFIVDNDSSDNSVAIITDYLAQQNENKIQIVEDVNMLQNHFDSTIHYYLLCNSANVGFGAGNNIVLKQLKDLKVEFKYSWLLNNDLIVNQNTLSSLKNKIAKDSKIGCVGSVIMNLPDNHKIQSAGARYIKHLGISKLTYKNISYDAFKQEQNKKYNFDYLSGASIILNNLAVQEVDYFDDLFFLYSEEFDLQIRLKKRGYELKLDTDSLVYHKLSGGTSNNKHLFFYYYNMSIIILSKKHYGWLYTALVLISLPIITFFRTFPSFKNFKWGLKGILKGTFK